MAVTVRLFAALRDAAAASEVEATPGRLPDVIAELSDRFGEPFASRVAVASALVDGTPVRTDADVDVADDAEVALLPPFSGGATTDGRPAGNAQERRVQSLLLVGSILVPALLVVGVQADRWTLGLVVGVVAVGSLIDLHVSFAAIGVRTVLPGAAVIALAPVGLILARPDIATSWLPGTVAIGVMLTFLLAVASQRRHDTALIVGSTALSGLYVALGAGALVLLFDALPPARLTGILALIASADAATVIATRLSPHPRPQMRRLTPAAVAVAIPVAIVVQATAGFAGTVVPVIGFALVAVLAAVASARLRQVLRRPDVTARPQPALLVGTADAVLLGVPLTALWLASL